MVINPGGLIGKLTVKDLYEKSIPRNPLLFDLMQRMELAEKAGSGLIRMRKAMKAYKLSVPRIKADKHWFSIYFIRPEMERIVGDKPLPARVVVEGLNEGLKTLLSAIKENPGIKAKDLNPLLNGRPVKTIERQIKTLIENNLIERRGSRKTGGYIALNGKN